MFLWLVERQNGINEVFCKPNMATLDALICIFHMAYEYKQYV